MKKSVSNSPKLWTLVAALLFSIAAAPGQEKIRNLTDDGITDRVETEMLFQAEVPANFIDVSTSNGIVTLTGTTDNMLAKTEAENVAMAVKGVKGVINRIEVDPAFHPDDAIQENIEEALLYNPATESYEIEVTVNEGIATLRGEVDSWQEKKLAAQVAKSVDGIQDLRNELTFRIDEDRPDIEIEREIKAALRNDIRLEAHLITIDVTDGRVTLSGEVGSLSEKRQAENYAWTAGVRSVDTEQLEVTEWTREKHLKEPGLSMRSDAEIKEGIEMALLYDPRVVSFQPEVEVQDGTVTLRGVVDNAKAKRAAEADARNVAGVLNVRNYLKVRPTAIPGDDLLEERINKAFARNATVERFEVDVIADDGVVYLRGNVDNQYERNRAEDIVSDVKGVVEVINNLQVYNETAVPYNYYYPYEWNTYFPSPYVYPDNYYRYPMTDNQIRDNIEDELWWSPQVNEYQIEVSVESGVATLTGTVDSWQEKNAAVENAYEGGADAVVDRLRIANGNEDNDQ
jgi:osmotically-inducible protein OsmY